MSNITNYYSRSELALAAYSEFFQGMNLDAYIVALRNDDEGMSLAQARDFADKWRVLDQYDGVIEAIDIDEFGQEHTYMKTTGLSVTLFENVKTGEQVVAVRGTDDMLDVITDVVDIGVIGTAEKQEQYAALSAKVQQWLGDGVLQSGFSVTGHSLGGFLSANLAIDYSGDITHTYLYNAPGVTGVAEGLLQAIHNTLSPDNPINIPNVLPISNIIASGDIVSSVGMYVSTPIMMSVEARLPLGAHSMVRVTDALAIYNLFSSIDFRETLSDLSSILNAASNRINESLETLVYELSELLMAPIVVPKGDRNALYQAIHTIETELFIDRAIADPQLKPIYQNLEVESLARLSRDQIAAQANDDISYRYALMQLNSFAISGRESLYDEHNRNGELELYDAILESGLLTDQYISDRAYYLTELLDRNIHDLQNLTISGDGALFWDADEGQFVSASDPEVVVRQDWDILEHYRFGGDGDEREGQLTGGSRADQIYGGGGEDILMGNEGNDYLEGNDGVDTLDGGDGDDELHGGAGDDHRIHNSGLLGGAGDDSLYGETGHDTLDGGTGRDLLVGGSGQDILEGGQGIDVLSGDIGWIDTDREIVELRDDEEIDILRGGEGDDLYFAGAGDIIDDSDGQGNVCVSMTLRDGSQQYVQLGLYNIRGTSDPNIYIEHNAYHDLDIEYRLEGDGTLVINDDVRIENFQDTQLGIALDFPSGTSLRYDSYWWNWFADGQYGWVHNTVDQYYASYDVPWAFPARAFVDSRLETERLLALSWELVLGDDATIVHGTDRDDPIHGHEWDDNIQGGEGDDTIDGGAGNDWLSGNEGSDQLNGGEGADQLFGGTGNDTLDGGAGGDRLLGGDGDDILYASDGDVLRGDRGSDRYLYGPGAGDIWIENYDFDQASEDVLQFLAGIQPSDVTLSREIDDLVLTIQGDHVGSVTVRHYFANFDDSENAFTAIEFSDGTRWDRAWISNWLDETGGGNDVISGTNEADVLEGYAGDDQLRGSAGDDTLLGGDGNDRLYGDEGNDRLESGNGYDQVHGGQGDDHLIGGTQEGFDELHGEEGNDTIECGLGLCTGGAGDDTYIHTAGQGRIVISNADTDGTGFDQLRLQGISSADVSILRRSTVSGFSGIHQDVLELRYQIDGVYEYIIISGYFEQDGNGGQTIDQIVFDDGTSWDFDYVNNSVRQATDDYDELFASVEGDTLNGLAGDDNLYGNDGDDQLYGDAGDDFMEGGAGDDLLHGGSGNDRMGGGLGSDLYLYNIGDGHDLIYADATGHSSESQNDINRIRLGEGLDRDSVRFIPINQDRYRGSQNGYSNLPGEHLRIEIIETGESLTVQNYFSEYRDPDNSQSYPYLIEFHDGSSISREEIISLCTDVTAGTDYYLGDNNADSIHLLQGDDYANGGEGDDQLFGDEGDDWLYGAEGHDELDGGQGNDRLEGREGNDYLNGGAGDDTLYAAQGDDELIGGEGNDELLGDHGNDTLDGGSGVDTAAGGSGDDTYLFGLGDGSFTINNYDATSGRNDVLRFKTGVSVSDVVMTREGLDLVLSLGTGDDRVTVTDYFLDGSHGDYALNAIEFEDGTIWDASTIADALLQPSAGDDLLYADINGSELDGQAGNDSLYGAEGNDQLSGGAGDDTLEGGAGDDRLMGGDGGDAIQGGEGNDVVLGEAGDDILHGGEGDDHLSGGAGIDEVNGDTGDDLLEISAGTNTLLGGGGNDIYLINTSAGTNTIINRNDLNENAFDRIVFDEAITPDMVTLSRMEDDLVIACPNSTTRVERFCIDNLFSRIDSLIFADGTYWSYEDVLGMLLTGDASDEVITGYDTDDRIDGGAGNDTIDGRMGNDRILGGEGDDTLLGGMGDDQLTGGQGNDHLEGGEGNDSYQFSSGDGLDVIEDINGTNRIEYIDLTSSQVDVNRSGNDLIVTDIHGGGQITILNQFGGIQNSSPITPIQEVHFSDGVVWDADELLNQITQGGADNDLLEGTAEADRIQSLAGDDDVYAHEGDDLVDGGAGDDYLFGESGNDLLMGGQDNDFLLGMEDHDHLDGGSGNDVLIGSNIWPRYYDISGLRDRFTNDNYGFDTWNQPFWSDDTRAEYDLLQGGEGADVLIGSGELYGGSGGDRLMGSGVLYGEAGDDHLIVEGVNERINGEYYVRNDPDRRGSYYQRYPLAVYDEDYGMSLLDGGEGNDYLEGRGNTTYRFRLGDGQDTIFNNDGSQTVRRGRVLFEEGVEASSVTFQRQGTDLVVHYGNGNDSITIQRWFERANNPGYPYHNTFRWQLEQFEFADGTIITAEQASTGLSTDDVPFDDLPPPDQDPVTLVGDDWSDQLYGGSADDSLSGAGGYDQLYGRAGDDILRGGRGPDLLEGGDGNDTYLYSPGDGLDIIDNQDNDGGVDVLRFEAGISPDDVTLTRDRNNLVLTFPGGGVSVISYFQDDGENTYALDTIEFANGISWDYAFVLSNLTQGTDGTDDIYGNLAADVLDGLAGDDSLYGSGGEDHLSGGEGDDRLYGQEAADTLNGNGGNDWLYGGAADDSLVGEAGSDNLVGGLGDDTLIGGIGDDRYYYSLGHGVDVIDNTGGGYDRITFTDISFNRLGLFQDGDDLLILVDDDLTQSVRVTSHFLGGDLAIDFIQTSDGETISAEQILSLVTPLIQPPPDPSTQDHSLTSGVTGGSVSEETAPPDDSNDTGGEPVDGDTPTDPVDPPTSSSDDRITGSDAGEVLIAGIGNDTLDGGLGNDLLLGDSGDDTYQFTGGQDSLMESSGVDCLVFGNGITFDQVSSNLLRSGDDLILTVDGGTDQITLTDFFLGGDNLVESIEFETGGSISAEQIFSVFGLAIPTADSGFAQTHTGDSADNQLSGTDQADLIQGFNGNDQLQGNEGNDRIEGGNDSDSLYGGAGNDLLIGGRGDDTYIFSVGDGQDRIDNRGGGFDTLQFEGIEFSEIASGLMRSGDDLILRVGSSYDQIALQDFFLGGDYVVDRFVFTTGGEISAEQIFNAFGVTNPDLMGSPDYSNLPNEQDFETVTQGDDSAANYLASSGDDFIDGGAGDDQLQGNAGNDYLIGGLGSDTYLIGTSSGQDRINNYDAGDSSTDTLRFEEAVIDDLWFSRVGDDLTINLVGSDDQVTIEQWYSDPAQEVDRIEAGGSVLLNQQLEQLVMAMASHDVPSGAGSVIPQEVRENLQPVIAESWQTIA
ncbi:MAG: calcium-binding protein [Candidatus Thiodiazotropha taylori]